MRVREKVERRGGRYRKREGKWKIEKEGWSLRKREGRERGRYKQEGPEMPYKITNYY